MEVAPARDLKAELAAAERQLAAAQAAAEALVGEEKAALASDELYASLERRKKLAAREIARLEQVERDIEVAIDDELAARELAEFERQCAAVNERNLAVRRSGVSMRTWSAASLTDSQRAKLVAKRKAAYEAVYPETKHGATGRGRAKGRQLGNSNDRFTADTALKTGRSERSVQRDVTRAKALGRGLKPSPYSGGSE